MISNAKNCLSGILSRFFDKQSQFTKMTLSGDHKAAKEVALQLYQSQPQYLLLNSYLDLENSKPVLVASLKRCSNLDPNFLYILLKDSRLSYDELYRAVGRVVETCNGFMSKILRKEAFLRSRGVVLDNNFADRIERYRSLPDTKKLDIDKELEDTLDEVDDFSLYDYAITHGVELKERDTLNYRWYKMIQYKDTAISKDIIKRSICFNEILKVHRIVKVENTGSKTRDILKAFSNIIAH